MDWTLEVVILPVSDIDRSIVFYRDQVGFELDHDTRNEHMRVVQLTPRGSGCSTRMRSAPVLRARRCCASSKRCASGRSSSTHR